MSDTYILEIVQKFAIQATRHEGHEKWWLDWAVDSPAGASKHLTSSWLAMKALAEVYDKEEIGFVYESFGGVGAQGMMIEDLFAPDVHNIGEWSDDAVDHLRKTFRDSKTVRVYKQDAYDVLLPYEGYDLVAFDCGDLTAWKTRPGEKHRQALDKVFSAKPKAVLLTDIACRYLHLHRERYETMLGKGTCVDYPSYLVAFLARIRALWGYRPVAVYYDRWSAVTALVPDGGDYEFPLNPTPDSPIGLAVL